MTHPNVEELFARTLLDDYDAHAPWEAVNKLRSIGSREIFESASAWCGSDEPLKRARGADILAQLGKAIEQPDGNYSEECFSVVAAMLREEKIPLPLNSAIHALGHIGDPRGISLVVVHRSHSDSEVRFAVACALGSFSDDLRAAETLIQLTRDEDEDVRDWATFGIGALGKIDSPEIRDALLARLDDPFVDARFEAIAGLARLQDRRALSALLAELNDPPAPEIVLDAAREMLGLSDPVEGWNTADYTAALRERFSC